MRNLDANRAKWMRVRIGALSAFLASGIGLLVNGAARVQIEDAAAWKQAAESQRQKRVQVQPKRGTITDRNGTPLAVSVEVPSVSVDVVEMLKGITDKDKEAVLLKDAAGKIARALALEEAQVYEKLLARKRFQWLKRRVSSEEAQAIRTLGEIKQTEKPLRGLAIEGEGRRYYPGRELLGPVLGFVAPDGEGKDGLELALNDELKGHAEEVHGLRDRAGRLLFSEGSDDNDAMLGTEAVLSIDQAIQHIAEQELDAAQRTYETKGASLVVIDPNTGEVLALTSTPGYNPNDYGDSPVESRRDRVVTDRFEPGSVMKVFTFASALASGTLKPTETIFCEHGSYHVGNVTIHDTHENDWLTPTQILARSSNIGTLKVALRLGEPALYSGFRKFGFGEVSGIPLPGEASGVLRPKGRAWFEVETANASFGQGVSVTTLQLAMAMGAIANGGRLFEPTLIKRLTDAHGNVLRDGVPKAKRDVIPPWVARTVTEMLTAVVEDGGTGVEAAIEGYRVAGKTATAQKADPATGRYSEDKYTASFVGFVPADKPRLVVAVVFDEPMIGRYGGDLAGPVFRRVAEASLRYLGVTPNTNAPKLRDVKKDRDIAPNAIAVLGPHTNAADIAGPAFAGPPTATAVKVPDALGLPARDAIRVFANAGLVAQVDGAGKLVRQWPAAGTSVPKGTAVRLVFAPAS
jgi:cell division protein FtsI (penicillin-binding protein 3)